MPAKISDDTWAKFDRLVGQLGWSVKRAAEECGIGRTAAHEHIKNQRLNGPAYAKRKDENEIPDPIPFEELGPNARRALEDFAFFRSYYLGRETKPWQVKAAETMLDLLESDYDEYAVFNEPPGTGKSTTFTLDTPTWAIIRNRRIRVQIGSVTNKLAKDYTLAIRRELERPYIPEGAQGCIARDFGRFKPDVPELWRADEFIVEQFSGQTIDKKEPTVRAISQEMQFIGARGDLVIWDDLVSEKNTRSADTRESLELFWDTYAETRLEPGGLLVLQGQRIAPDDLYRYALGKLAGDELVQEGMEPEELDELPRKYHHVVFPAHFDDECQAEHGTMEMVEIDGRLGRRKRYVPPPAWPDGCLLDPVRLSWRKLTGIKRNNQRLYEISYQQRDTGTGQYLVDERWLEGGTDPQTGEEFPGCFDRDRAGGEAVVTVGGHISAMTVDPSPTKFWSVQWWIFEERTETRYLCDLRRERMGANDFLDITADGKYVGLAEEWVQRAKAQGRPITHLIVERNAAQRFMLQYNHFKAWLRLHGITLVPHDTTANKSDPEYGVQTLGSLYRLGRVRLPWKVPWGRKISQPLVDEATRWPDGTYDDCVMAQWFFEWNLRKLRFASKQRIKRKMPGWLNAGTPKVRAPAA